jgi:ABC-type amino acid transport substrate-binding protein
MRRLIIAFAAALGVSLFYGLAFSAPVPPVTLRVGVENLDYYPFYASDGQHFWGYARDVLDAFAAHSGYRLIYEPLPPTQLFQLFLDSRRLDLKFPDNPQWSPQAKRSVRVSYSEPVATIKEGVVLRRMQLGQPLSHLHSIGTVRGFTMPSYQSYIDRAQLHAVEGSSLDSLLLALASGSVDAVYADFHVAQQRLKLLRLEDKLAMAPQLPVDHSDLDLATLQHPDVVQAFNQFLRDNEAFILTLKRRYGLTSATH